MKKTIIISAIALCFSMVSVHAKTDHPTIKNYDVETYFKVNSFCVSIAKGDFETVQKLITRGADINERSNGMTPAMYAAKFNRVEILNLLISNGADLKAKSDKKMTAADYAELHGAQETLAIIKAVTAKKKRK